MALTLAAAFTGAAVVAAMPGASPRANALMRALTLASMGFGVGAWLADGAGLALAGALMLTADVAWTALVMRDPDLPADLDGDERDRLLALRRRRLSAVRPAIGGWAVLFFLLAVSLG